MRIIQQALANAARIRDELPHLIQPSASDYDMVLLAARLAHAEALLREAGTWLEVNYHGARELDARIDAFLAPDSAPAAPCPLQGPKSAVVPTVCPVCNNDISKCTLVISAPDQPISASEEGE